MKQFDLYIEKIHTDVCEREPLNDKEYGFRMAVMMIHHVYKISIGKEELKDQKPMTLQELLQEINKSDE